MTRSVGNEVKWEMGARRTLACRNRMPNKRPISRRSCVAREQARRSRRYKIRLRPQALSHLPRAASHRYPLSLLISHKGAAVRRSHSWQTQQMCAVPPIGPAIPTPLVWRSTHGDRQKTPGSSSRGQWRRSWRYARSGSQGPHPAAACHLHSERG
jgi:hypothetical protein